MSVLLIFVHWQKYVSANNRCSKNKTTAFRSINNDTLTGPYTWCGSVHRISQNQAGIALHLAHFQVIDLNFNHFFENQNRFMMCIEMNPVSLRAQKVLLGTLNIADKWNALLDSICWQKQLLLSLQAKLWYEFRFFIVVNFSKLISKNSGKSLYLYTLYRKQTIDKMRL